MSAISLILLQANRTALSLVGDLGVYRPLSVIDDPSEYFTIVTATEWQGEEVAISVTDFVIQMLDRSWQRGDLVVMGGTDTYEIHNIVSRDAGMLSLIATKM